jgi:predicted transposase YbfD/YdcC
MPSAPLPILMEYLSDLPDPRVERTRLHRLLDVLTIGICAVICGAEGWDDISEFGRAKEEWLREKLGLSLPNGIPSADTFRRVFARLQPQKLQEAFRRWTQQLYVMTQGEVISLDGKVLRHSFDTAFDQSAIHMVSAWASSARLVLGAVKVNEKSNEITAVPLLLAAMDLEGCIITADALNTQKSIAAQIVAQGADYLLPVKENHPHLYQDIQNLFAHARAHRYEGLEHSHRTSRTYGHGRSETRECDAILLQKNDPFWGDMQQEWSKLSSLVRIERTRETAKGNTSEVAYYISSLRAEAAVYQRAARSHWGIENRVHYVLDVSMEEDNCRIRRDHGAENFAVLRHIALNLLRQEQTKKAGVKAKQKMSGWNHEYLAKVLLADAN